MLWSDVANPVDLNTRLYRAPAGLVLYAANAINDDGAIVADSSAGLVLRERRGTGDVSLRHTFCKAGAFTVKIKVTDRAGNATQVQRRVTVN